MTITIVPQIAQTHEPQFDRKLRQYVALTLDGLEVFGNSWGECFQRLAGANDVILDHRQRNGEEMAQ